MLRVSGVPADRLGYYLADVGEEMRIVAPTIEAPGSAWAGASAAHLGLKGTVDEGSLAALLEGRNPRTGHRLTSRVRSVAAFDLTFSAPKSVSLLFGLAGPSQSRQALDAHSGAVDAAVGYLEHHAVAVRRGSADEREALPTDGVAAAGFTHALSRARDPHLHTHLLVANLAHARDGRWGAIDGRGLRAHARAAGAVYDAHLRMELSRRLSAGWSWRDPGGWQLAGTDPVLAAAFSGRSAEIRQELANRASSSGRSRHVAWASTRDPKDLAGGREAVAVDWSRRARIAPGWTLRPGSAERSPHLDEYRFAAVVASSGPSGPCRRDVVVAWSEATASGLDGRRLDEAVDHWSPADPSVGVAEPRFGPARCTPSPHLVRMLGPRPTGPEDQPVWKQAAARIDRYRERWGVGEDEFRSSGAPGWPARRLAEHLEVERSTREARALLSWVAVAPRARDGLQAER